MTEQMYQNLVLQSAVGAPTDERTASGALNGKRESIHLDDYPVADESLIDESLSRATRLIMRLSSLGRAARSKAGIKVRQPVQTMKVLVSSASDKATIESLSDQLKEELNVKEVEVIYNSGVMGDIHFWDWKVSPNMRSLGPKYGPRLREITEGLAAMDPREVVTKLRQREKIVIPSSDESLPPIELGKSIMDELKDKLRDELSRIVDSAPPSVEYLSADEASDILQEKIAPEGFSTEEDRSYSVAMSTVVTPELRLEGDARELIHGIQNMRRSADFDIADYIVTYYQGSPELDAVIAAHSDYIQQETLSRQLINRPPAAGAHTETLKVNNIQATIAVRRE